MPTTTTARPRTGTTPPAGDRPGPAGTYALTVPAGPPDPDRGETLPAGTVVVVWKLQHGSSVDRYWSTAAGLLVYRSRTGGRHWTWHRAVDRAGIVADVAKREALGFVLVGSPTTMALPVPLTRLPKDHPDRTTKPEAAGVPAPTRSALRKALDEAVAATL